MTDTATCELKIHAKFSSGSKVQMEFKNVPESVVADIIELIQTARNACTTG